MGLDTVSSGPFLLASVVLVRDDGVSSEEPLCNLLRHGMIGIYRKERLGPVPDWLYPYSLTVRTV